MALHRALLTLRGDLHYFTWVTSRIEHHDIEDGHISPP